MQTKQNDLVFNDGESQRYFFNVTGEATADLCLTVRPHLYAHYSSGRQKWLKEAFVMEEVKTSLIPVFFACR